MKLPKYLLPISAVGTAVGLVVLLKDNMGGQRFKSTQRIAGKTVVITGCTSGIGKEVAKDLAGRGGRIIMGCRDLVKCEELRQQIINDTYNTNVHCKQLDLASLKSVRQFAEDINKNEKRLDILINNAGVIQDERKVTEDGFELHIGVNYLSQFLLTNLLTEKLVSCSPSRIILTSCAGYENATVRFSDLNSENLFIYDEVYNQSKLALCTFGYELANRLLDKGVTVNMVVPGFTQTNLHSNLSMNSSLISGTILKPIWYLLFKTPAQGAQTTIYSAVEPSIATSTGGLYSDCREIPLAPKVKDAEIRRRLWLTSQLWTAERPAAAALEAASPKIGSAAAAAGKTSSETWSATPANDSSKNNLSSSVVKTTVQSVVQ